MPLPSADELQQLEDIEKQWAVKASFPVARGGGKFEYAMHHAETYFNLISRVKPEVQDRLRLTSIDSEIYDDFVEHFPEVVEKLKHLDDDLFKKPALKEKWRRWINKYENRVNEFNFGTLLRIDPKEDYTEKNTMFGVRMQFYAVEIARLRKGLNKAIAKN